MSGNFGAIALLCVVLIIAPTLATWFNKRK